MTTSRDRRGPPQQQRRQWELCSPSRSSSSALSSTHRRMLRRRQLLVLFLVVLVSLSSRCEAAGPSWWTSVSSKSSFSLSVVSPTKRVNKPASPSFLPPPSFLTWRGGGGGGNRGSSTQKKKKHRTTPQRHPQQHTQEKFEGASIATTVFNLANNVAGAGILTLSGGMAQSQTGYLPSMFIVLILAAVASHTFGLVGKSCALVGGGVSGQHNTEFKDLWTYAFGSDDDDRKPSKSTTTKHNSAWIVDSMVFLQCFLVSIIYGGLLGDVFTTLLRGTLGIETWYTTRSSLIVVLSTTVLLPLTLIRDLSALGFTSILGLCAVLYTVGFIIYRALDGSYTLGSGKFIVARSATALTALPNFTTTSPWNLNWNSLVLVSNLGLAFIAHYNGPSYWKSLQPTATSEKFCIIAKFAYTILAVLYVVTMIAGYATFGDASLGNILLNYSSNDTLALFGRLATGLSIIFGFPLIAVGCREGIKNTLAALEIEPWATAVNNPHNHARLVVCLLTITTFLSVIAKDIGLVVGLTGALMGSALVYICPPLLYTKILKRKYGTHSPEYQHAKTSLLYIPFGIFTGLVGILMTLKNAASSSSSAV